uniref:Uncharacterized protein n=1 Tax=Leersia perrieri TaxID=77586 RepID=A0A0D9W307_9ORYZ
MEELLHHLDVCTCSSFSESVKLKTKATDLRKTLEEQKNSSDLKDTVNSLLLQIKFRDEIRPKVGEQALGGGGKEGDDPISPQG